MKNQNTLAKGFKLVGLEPYGGNLVELTFHPEEPNTGINFMSEHGLIPAKLEYAKPYKSSIMLKKDKKYFLHVEHVLATLWAYGVDNATINVRRMQSKSFRKLKKMHLATNISVIPNFEGETYELCEKLDNNLEEQDKPRKLLRVKRYFGDLENDGILIRPKSHGLEVRATTDYPFLGTENFIQNITSKTYKQELAKARAYAKHYINLPDKIVNFLASYVFNPSFGLEHGFDPKENIFLPIKNEDDLFRATEIYKEGCEIARHTILDKLGAIALLPGRLDGVIFETKRSSHANDIYVLNKLVKSSKDYLDII